MCDKRDQATGAPYALGDQKTGVRGRVVGCWWEGVGWDAHDSASSAFLFLPPTQNPLPTKQGLQALGCTWGKGG